MDQTDAVVIGAGVVGLAVARALARRGLATLVLEQFDAIGSVISARNSEVIHAGIYYPTGSLKARMCVAGRDLLYAYCEAHGVGHRRCGKLVVATSQSQTAHLERILAQARKNGVLDLQRLDGREVSALEPALVSVAGLLSPSTGIVDGHGLMRSLRADLEAAGGALALRSPVHALACGASRHVVQVAGQEPTELAARIVVNSAGLWAPGLAARTEGLDPRHVAEARYAKGSYYTLTMPSPFSRLVYPMPEDGGLGVHLTLDLAGQARFGPDVEWIDPGTPEQIDYRVDESRAAAFEASVRRYWPGLPTGALAPAYSGVRPRLVQAGDAPQDFVLQGPADHGIEGLMNLFGIESPGLTASLAIADEVLVRLGLGSAGSSVGVDRPR